MELHPRTLPPQAVGQRTADAPARHRATAAEIFNASVKLALRSRARFHQTPRLNLINYLGPAPHREIPKSRQPL